MTGSALVPLWPSAADCCPITWHVALLLFVVLSAASLSVVTPGVMSLSSAMSSEAFPSLVVSSAAFLSFVMSSEAQRSRDIWVRTQGASVSRPEASTSLGVTRRGAGLLPAVVSGPVRCSRIVGWVLDPRGDSAGARSTRGLRTHPTEVLPARDLDCTRADRKRSDVLEG